MKTYAEVAWTPEDVISYAEMAPRERKLTEDEARDFLVENQKYLRDRLIELGWEVMGDLLWSWLDERDSLQPEESGGLDNWEKCEDCVHGTIHQEGDQADCEAVGLSSVQIAQIRDDLYRTGTCPYYAWKH